MKDHSMKSTLTKISLVFLLVSLAGLLNPADLQADDHLFIRVIAARANVHQSPSMPAPVILSVEKGRVFDVLEKSGEWYTIQLSTGAKGYIHSSVVEEVAEDVAPVKEKTVTTPPPPPMFIRIIATLANVHQGASMPSPVILAIEKGQVFNVLEKSGEWYAIQLSTGAKGYLHASVVEEVAEAVAPVKTKTVPPPPPTPTAPARKTVAPAAPVKTEPPAVKEPFSMFLLRAGFFLAGDSAFGDVYKNGAVFGGELRIGKGKIVGWLEGTYRAHTGKFTFTGEETKMNVMAVEAGALYRFKSGPMTPYAGLGLGYHMFTETNDIRGEAKQSKIGFCALAGVTMAFGKSLAVDGRVKYSTCSMQPADFKINVGGLTIGLGAGLRF